MQNYVLDISPQILQQDTNVNTEEDIQKYSRLVIVSLSLFFQFVVILTITSSLRRRFWPFKLILFSSFCEILLLTLVLFSIYYNDCQGFCQYSGYVVHVLWLASIASQSMVMYLYLQYLEAFYPKNDMEKRRLLLYTQFIERKYIFVCLILLSIPSLFLLFPLLQDMFGKTGWRLSNSQDFIIYCGFIWKNYRDDAKCLIIYSIFWALPIILLLVFSLTKIIKIGDKLKRNDIIPEEHVFINRIIKIPLISITCWIINIAIRITDHLLVKDYQMNLTAYIIYSFLNVIFEMHVIVICLVFLTSFRKLTIISQDFMSVSSHHIAAPQLEDPMLGSNNELFYQNGVHQLQQIPEVAQQNNSQESINTQ